MRLMRSSGILLHITSLPSDFGIGDMGPSAYHFADFLRQSGQKYWQLLPLNPTSLTFGNSPYSSPSAFAGNLLLISPEELVKDGYLTKRDLKHNYRFDDDHVQFDVVTAFKKNILEKAFDNFRKIRAATKAFDDFSSKNKDWLDDYALFTSLKSHFKGVGWHEWPEQIRDRKPKELVKVSVKIAKDIEREKFFQFIFFQQWARLKKYCHQQEISLVGDIPFYVNHDSVDCWANAKYFKLDSEKRPVAVSGVPPDYFSETGQLWGTPVYDWDTLQQNNFRWWIERLKQNLFLFDIVRLDHFRAFSAYWEVPAAHDTAVNGKWIKCPGTSFFEKVKESFPNMPFIAEDLGTLDEPVLKLRDRFKLPGMRVLLFAFGDEMSKGPYIPHHHIRNCLVYTGTHDNNTVKGWYQQANRDERKRLKAYSDRRITPDNVAPILQRMALMSVGAVAILPLQDVLGLGDEGIMNRPGTTSGNWTWRLLPGQLAPAVARKLKNLNELYDRS